ncbi:MAG: hypothetical protein AAF431_18480, partial [Pseudomonadota bacterium]
MSVVNYKGQSVWRKILDVAKYVHLPENCTSAGRQKSPNRQPLTYAHYFRWAPGGPLYGLPLQYQPYLVFSTLIT